MGLPTATLARTALALAALAAATTASAEPIRVLNAGAEPRAAAPASDCAAASPGVGADIECVLSLAPPEGDAQATAPTRILIRAQWAAKRCAPRKAQVVDLPGPRARATTTPVVDQAGSGRACAS